MSEKTISSSFFEFLVIKLALIFCLLLLVILFISLFSYFYRSPFTFFTLFPFFLHILLIGEASAVKGEGDLDAVVKISASPVSCDDLVLPKIIKSFSENDKDAVASLITAAPSTSFSSSSKNIQQVMRNFEFLTESLAIRDTPKGVHYLPPCLIFPAENAKILLPSAELNSLAKFNAHFHDDKSNFAKILILNDKVYLFSLNDKEFSQVNRGLKEDITAYLHLNAKTLKIFNLQLKHGLSVPATSLSTLDGFTVSDMGSVISISSNKSARDFEDLNNKLLNVDTGSNLNVMCKNNEGNLTLVSRVGINNPAIIVQELNSVTSEDSLKFKQKLDAQVNFINTKLLLFPKEIDSLREHSLTTRFKHQALAPNFFAPNNFYPCTYNASLLKKIFRH